MKLWPTFSSVLILGLATIIIQNTFFCCSVFVFRVPDNAKIGDKMIYASAKDTVKKEFSGLSLEFQANDKDDLNYDYIKEEVLKKA